MIRRICVSLVFSLGIWVLPAGPSEALTFSKFDDGSLLNKVANGCGPNRYRGPGGACHRFGTGPFPGGYYGRRPAYRGNGCPPGYWRGPWGHCRNTPYHGRLPGGGWR